MFLIWEGNRGWTFSLKAALSWIISDILVISDGLKLDFIYDGFLSKLFTWQDANWWTVVMWIIISNQCSKSRSSYFRSLISATASWDFRTAIVLAIGHIFSLVLSGRDRAIWLKAVIVPNTCQPFQEFPASTLHPCVD